MRPFKDHFILTYATGESLDWGVYEFPDGQIQFWVENYEGRFVNVRCGLYNPYDLDLLTQISHVCNINKLDVAYLYGARSDKYKNGNKTVCNIAVNIQNFLFENSIRPVVLSPHCEIKCGVGGVFPVPPLDYATLIYPDESAKERFQNSIDEYYEETRSLPGQYTCIKQRDQETSKIIKHEIPQELDFIVLGKTLVLDDLCDGGATFIKLAQEIQNLSSQPSQLDLCITHGIFSNDAIPKLLYYYDNIWVTNSYPWANDLHKIYCERIKILDVWNNIPFKELKWSS